VEQSSALGGRKEVVNEFEGPCHKWDVGKTGTAVINRG
jgi:hypothetical protein